MSKLNRAYLQQGKVRYSLIPCGFEIISNVKTSPAWKVFIEANNISRISEAMKNDPVFLFHAEFTALEKGKPILETIHGDIAILDIGINDNGVFPKSYIIRAIAQQLRFANAEICTREKVSFT